MARPAGIRRAYGAGETNSGPVVLLFVDGLGWGAPDPARNPCHGYGGRLFALPDPREAAGEPIPIQGGGWARPLDAALGVPGIPQSATGQTTLLAGLNAQGRLGHHLTGFPNAALRELLLERSLLRTLTLGGVASIFLNCYRPAFFLLSRERRLRLSATTVANLAAGLPFLTLDDLRAGRALYQEFTNLELRERGFDVPLLSPAEAGRRLGREARRRGFTLFEYFQTDRAGHAQDPARAARELARLEAFVAALLAELELGQGEAPPGASLVLLTSDHGNLEDLATRGHTRNPVPLLAWGAGARRLARETADLSQVAPAIVRRLVPGRAGAPHLRERGPEAAR